MVSVLDRLLSMLPEHLDYALLLFLRVGGLIVTSPVFGRSSIPNMSKVAYSLMITGVFLLGIANPTVSLEYEGIFPFILLCLTELLFGVVLSFVTTMFINITFTAGNIIDTQMGFGMVNVFDPQSGAQVAVTGNLFNIVLLICFFALNGHQKLIHILYQTLEAIPVGMVRPTPQLAVTAAEAFCNSFLLAIHVAMPFIASGLLAEVALGVIIRTVPQMNMFVVGIPLKVLIGFLMLIMVMPIFIRYSTTIFDNMFYAIELMFSGLMGAT